MTEFSIPFRLYVLLTMAYLQKFRMFMDHSCKSVVDPDSRENSDPGCAKKILIPE